VVGIALSFPAWNSASFFSRASPKPEREFDFIAYIPTNPFFPLANTIVPAIVVFSLAGVALIGAPGKATLLPPCRPPRVCSADRRNGRARGADRRLA
jgi:hypothetical protein